MLYLCVSNLDGSSALRLTIATYHVLVAYKTVCKWSNNTSCVSVHLQT